MDDELMLNRPSDRRLACEHSDLPPGPPGAENDTFELVRSETKTKDVPNESRPRSPSPSRPRDRRSRSKSRRPRSSSRGRNYSPPTRRRYAGTTRNRRSPDRNRRSPDRVRNRSRGRLERRRGRRERSRSRDRYRGRRSRTTSPRSRHWSPEAKKPASPPPLSPVVPMNQAPAFSVPPPTVYADSYGNYTNQYVRQQFANYDYSSQAPPAPPFANAYPPPQTPVLTQPIPPGDDFNSSTWIHAPALTPTAVPEPVPQAVVIPTPPTENEENKLKRDAAVAQEVQNQRDELKKQRDEYLKRAGALKRELKILKEQRNDLLSVPTSPTTKGFLKENDRLQSQIQNKLKTMENVIDMLCGIIGEESPNPKKTKKKKTESENDDSSPERLKSKLIESMKNKPQKKENIPAVTQIEAKPNEESPSKKVDDSIKHVNYVFYDHELHWCDACDVFPKTAKDYLNHLHSKEHTEKVELQETPWHDDIASDELPSYPNAPTKRTPIRGLQFFIPSTSWYCKLCKCWMGDLHCASAHLKSQTHSDNYNEFTEQNPHFEVDWMADRQKAYDVVREKDSLPPPPPQITSVSTTGIDLLEGIPLQINQKPVEVDDKKVKRKKKKSEEKKEKKKKKRSKKRKKMSSSSSSSSSESTSESESEKEKKSAKDDRSNSIRVAMRNMLKNQKDGKPSEEVDNRGKWTTVQQSPVGNSAVTQPPPPPPTQVPKVDPDTRKRDDIMILQWNTPQPIISESEKKLLEELKGKLKNKPSAENIKNEIQKEESSKSMKILKSSSSKKRDQSPKSYDNKEKSKRSRSRSRNRKSGSPARGRSKRSKTKSPVRSRSRDRRSRSRGRQSPIRRRRRSRSRSPRRRTRSPSRYGRRRSYSRSRSRSRSHRIEKPIVRYPEFRPRVPPENKKVNKVKTEDETERKKSPITKKGQGPQPGAGKKLPFIGRMPVFKKQNPGGDGEKKEGEMCDEGLTENMHMGYDHYDGMNAMMDYEDLMPDPMQFVSLMGAPPPPPSGPPPSSHHEEDKDILPPGIDEAEADLVPKPISDAPIPRKGPLPRDFEEALNIIFPGEKRSEENDRDSKNATTLSEQRTSILQTQDRTVIEMPPLPTDDVSQQSPAEPFLGFPAVQIEMPPDTMEITGVPPPVTGCPPPPPPPEDNAKDVNGELDFKKNNKISSPNSITTDSRKEELDDLALLGIDADDLAAQCI